MSDQVEAVANLDGAETHNERHPELSSSHSTEQQQSAESHHEQHAHQEQSHIEPAHVEHHEPAHTEPAHAEPAHVEHHEPAHVEPALSDPANIEAHSEPAHVEHHEPARVEPAHVEHHEPIAHHEPAHVEHHEPVAHHEPAHVEPAHVEHHEPVAHHEPAHVEPAHVEHHEPVAHAEPAHVEPAHVEHQEPAHAEPAHVEHHEPAHVEHHEPVAHHEPAHAEPAHVEHHEPAHVEVSAHHEPVHTEPVGNVEPAHHEPVHVEHHESVHAEPTLAEPAHTEPAHIEHHEPVAHHEPAHVEHHEPVHAEPAHAEPAHVERHEPAHVEVSAHHEPVHTEPVGNVEPAHVEHHEPAHVETVKVEMAKAIPSATPETTTPQTTPSKIMTSKHAVHGDDRKPAVAAKPTPTTAVAAAQRTPSKQSSLTEESKRGSVSNTPSDEKRGSVVTSGGEFIKRESVSNGEGGVDETSFYSQKLLDNLWQKQQQKTFTAWANSHLRKRDLHIDDIQTAFHDGRMLLSLMEIVGGVELPKPTRGNMRIHKVETINKALKFINSRVALVGVGAEEITDGNLKMILGMMWTIILRFEIEQVSQEAGSARDGLLLWAQRKTAPYKNVNVQNFHMSWKDGLAFCALIHRHRPDLIDYNSLSRDNARENFRIAMEVADKYLDIPPMLDAEDMITCAKPDERSVMTYVVAFYKAFATSNKNDTAAKKINNVLQVNKDIDDALRDYEDGVTGLLTWIPTTTDKLNQRHPLNSVKECKEKYSVFHQYKSVEFPPRFVEKGNLETQLSTLQTKMRLSGRAPYVPKLGHTVDDIILAWKGLELAEKQHKEWVNAEIRRNKACEVKAARFNHKAKTHEQWTTGRVDDLTKNDYNDANYATIQALKKKHAAFLSDFAAHESRVGEIGTLAEELDHLNYYLKEETNARYASIYELWLELGKLSQLRSVALDEAEIKQQKLDELRLEYAKRVAPLNNSLDEWIDNLIEVIVAESIEEVEQVQEQLHDFHRILPVAEAEYQALAAIHNQMQQLGNVENPYTSQIWQDVVNKWNELQSLVPQKQTQLQDEVVKQQNDEKLRLDWAKKAAAAFEWLMKQDKDIETVVLAHNEAQKLEELLESLKRIDGEIIKGNPLFIELDKISKELQDSVVLDNKHSQLSIEDVRGLFEQLQSKLKQLKNEIANQILTRDLKGLSGEQIKEFRSSFLFFDKDQSQTLQPLEFRACLLSLEYDIPQVAPSNPAEDAEFNRIWSICDRDGNGYVTLDEFMVFMRDERADAETAEQLVEAFQVLAGDKKYVLADELRRDLNADLAEYCIARMTPFEGGPEGALDFTTYSHHIYNRHRTQGTK